MMDFINNREKLIGRRIKDIDYTSYGVVLTFDAVAFTGNGYAIFEIDSNGEICFRNKSTIEDMGLSKETAIRLGIVGAEEIEAHYKAKGIELAKKANEQEYAYFLQLKEKYEPEPTPIDSRLE